MRSPLFHALLRPLSALCLMAGLWCPVAQAQETTTRDVHIGFRTSVDRIDPSFGDNAARLTEAIDLLTQLTADTTLHLLHITFVGTCSPEGSYQVNARLSHRRMLALEEHIRSRVALPDSIVFRKDSFIPYEYLSDRLSTSDLPWRDKALDIIGSQEVDEPHDVRRPERRARLLKAMDGGRPWRYMLDHWFAEMRGASVWVTTELLPEPKDTIADIPCPYTLPQSDEPPTPAILVSAPAQEAPWIRRLYVKTNLLGWPMLLANVAVEIDLAPHWSLNVPAYYSSLNYFTRTIKWRTLGTQPELRYWPQAGDGVFVGAHFAVASYNIAKNGDTRTQDHNGHSPALGGGLSVGYRWLLKGNWRMEATAGAGVYRLHYDKFVNEANGQLIYTKHRTYFGPDQLSLNLIYTFDLKRKSQP